MINPDEIQLEVQTEPEIEKIVMNDPHHLTEEENIVFSLIREIVQS